MLTHLHAHLHANDPTLGLAPKEAVSPREFTTCPALKGFITEADLPRAEQEWPGLGAFYHQLPVQDRPTTFLELVWRYESFCAEHLAA